MEVAQQPEKYFNRKQFLLADSAYTNDCYVVPAFKGKHLLKRRNINFNYHLAQSRVRIEHAIGILKGRFASLREIRTQIRNAEEMKGAVKWIVTCIILHNLLADLKDRWNDLYEDEVPDDEESDSDDDDVPDYDLRAKMRRITLAHFA
jgi:hypothetical protein